MTSVVSDCLFILFQEEKGRKCHFCMQIENMHLKALELLILWKHECLSNISFTAVLPASLDQSAHSLRILPQSVGHSFIFLHISAHMLHAVRCSVSTQWPRQICRPVVTGWGKTLPAQMGQHFQTLLQTCSCHRSWTGKSGKWQYGICTPGVERHPAAWSVVRLRCHEGQITPSKSTFVGMCSAVMITVSHSRHSQQPS